MTALSAVHLPASCKRNLGIIVNVPFFNAVDDFETACGRCWSVGIPNGCAGNAETRRNRRSEGKQASGRSSTSSSTGK